jgi:1-acyl-sn-glycerol-3-phosphate acyltransferase
MSVVLPLIWDGLTGRFRNFKRDAQTCLATLSPPFRVEGREHIPEIGPYLVTVNHYARPGYQPWWHAMAISFGLPMPARWVMTSEWTAPGKWYAPLKSGLSRFAAVRIARTYGFATMPPMPPRLQDVDERARAVRALLALADREKNLVLCLAPEGADTPGGAMTWPPAGAGRFMALLAARGMRILPVGAWEQQGALCVRFGPTYALKLPVGLSPKEKDRLAAKTVMTHIAELVPQRLRGDFA